MNYKDFENNAREIRIRVLQMFYLNRWGHIVSAMSCADIISVLYSGGYILGDNIENNRIILSKGHGSAALYAAFSIFGIIDKEELSTFSQNGSRLFALAGNGIPEIEIPTGSLGHGFPYATGGAYVDKIEGYGKRTYVIMGDGESQEGTTWEAALFANNYCLDNLIVILDYNKIQGSNWIKREAEIEPISDKWKSFGWEVFSCNGHNCNELNSCLFQTQRLNHKPKLIIAHTIKGKGISIAENKPELHSWRPSDNDWEKICNEFGITKDDLRI